ncbi:coil containing protein [Vibrio phage 455E52-1]|nr:coil containing protein [Vibrio phage 455E52-1]
MTIKEYEMRFMTELEDNWQPSLTWGEWVKKSYAQFMDSVAEQELNMELNQL